MFNVLTLISGRKKKTGSGWISFNAPCCVHRGHKADRRGRGGIRVENQNWNYHCFNCNYTCGFKLGKSFSKKTRDFLTWCGATEKQIERWNFWSIGYRSIFEEQERKLVETKTNFVGKSLPWGSTILTERSNPEFYQYLQNRRVWDSTTFYVTPHDEISRNQNRIIIPFTYNDKIVGYTSRYLDDSGPKYINDMPHGYVFGVDKQKKEWQLCILVEGIFDALAIDGCAYMHSTISPEQAGIVNSLNRRVIVVPDQDPAGLQVCTRALQLGYQVSLPYWHSSVKDVNDAVRKYGKLPTMLSIIESATNSDIRLKLRIKEIEKQNRTAN